MIAATVLVFGPQPLFGRSCFFLLAVYAESTQRVWHIDSYLIGQMLIPGEAFASSFLLSSTYMHMEVRGYVMYGVGSTGKW